MTLTQSHNQLEPITIETLNPTNNSKHTKPYLLTEDNFKLIRQFQSEILEHLEMMPSLRKIINALITPENLTSLKPIFIPQRSIQNDN